MTDITEQAESLLGLSSHGWYIDPEYADLVSGLVAALKVARAEVERLRGEAE
jgi:hypothetical protein